MSYTAKRFAHKPPNSDYHVDEEMQGFSNDRSGNEESQAFLKDDEGTFESSATSSTCSSTHSSEALDGEGKPRNGESDYVSYNSDDDFFEKTGYIVDDPKPAFDSSTSSPKNQELILFGCDLSNLSSTWQFVICASGVLFFNLIYGYLQELIQIQIAGRQFAIFLGACQFAGYAFWSAVLSALRTWRLKRKRKLYRKDSFRDATVTYTADDESSVPTHQEQDNTGKTKTRAKTAETSTPPFFGFLALAIIRAIDLGLTNLSMRYLNYPAKTLIKSSRVIFTMIMGIIIGRKKYAGSDYVMVVLLVFGLSLFLHADMNSNAIFHPLGVLMLVTSLSLDGTVTNWSEVIMNRHNMGQDGFQMKLYMFSFLIMMLASFQADELVSGIRFFFQTPGTMSEVESNIESSWSIQDKVLTLFFFSTFGIFGGSCACAITKRFGALTMSVTTTTRKAATIFLSFAMFPNACTAEHITGVLIFVMGLLLKGGACGGFDLSKLSSYIRTKTFVWFPLVKRASCFKARV